MRPFFFLLVLSLALAGCAEIDKERPKPERSAFEKAFIGKPYILNRVVQPKAEVEAPSATSEEAFLVSP
jgi:hypothetical protein